MKFTAAFILLLSSAFLQAQPLFRLAAPYIRYHTIFFEKDLSVPLVFEQPGAQIRYTVDGSVPHTKSSLYRKPVPVQSNSVTVKARSFAKGFAPSNVEEVTFIKNGRPIAVSFPPPDQAYRGTGANMLTDNNGGITDHHNPSWLGYNTDSVVLNINMDDHQPLREVLFNVLQNHGAWIFYPSKAVIYSSTETGDWQLLHTAVAPVEKSDMVICKAFRLPLHGIKTQQLKLVLFNTPLPAWHPGSGNNSWMFIDEIKVY